MNRRGFLRAIGALAAAPVVAQAEVVTPIVPAQGTLLVGRLGTYEGFQFFTTRYTEQALQIWNEPEHWRKRYQAVKAAKQQFYGRRSRGKQWRKGV